MDNTLVGGDNIYSINVASTIKKLKSIRVTENNGFDKIIKFRFIAELMSNELFKSMLSDAEVDKLNQYLFKLRLSKDIALCNDLGDDSVFVGGTFTGGDSEMPKELDKLKKIVYTIVDYQPFDYREIFLNAYNYGNRY